MKNKQTPTQTVYLAIAEKLIKIGKSEYYRRSTRAGELNRKEELITVKQFDFIGSTVKALGLESMLRIAISLIDGTQHYGNDHFSATPQAIQISVDLFEEIMEAADKHLNSYVRDIRKIIRKYQSEQ